MASSLTSIKDKIRKVLAQACDRAGTDEGDTYFAKAFELMAHYELDERDLGGDDPGDAVTHMHIHFGGSYTDMQSTLLMAIARCLHCEGFVYSTYRSTKVGEAVVFGRARHLERVSTLYTLINPIMLARAWELRQDYHRGLYHSTVTLRRSFMRGFITMISTRLEEAEHGAADTSAAYGLALIDDASLARQARAEFIGDTPLNTRSGEGRTFAPGAYSRGVNEATVTDIGQYRMSRRAALEG
ncbi:hypothetical protein CCICO_03050 [Corynebacterium ciconiae DSM 44920]|uniref:DUF2786 domain-containing protein n=1 Tax=Corynebacterium ciconiae TaxID=227319 RepID=UPI00037DE065|nr:DUF2786 domain-containing protein [Corynebacterium ciconiae]WKD60655.1 hypothetical protein CCICO_03050 [Corynebacterium ciconiae DSM 44920]